ncbi:hypothetical protein B7R54_08485 [Subtercola boreus]|uniref:alpha-amylase n=1 Tax=Subtercola boreus TaxID=120213 RepID=A0A3E0VHX0_9MICO|nr:carboxypeptidase-like regulatory domain-containing protein [Subtercola boreus]RFA09259.1 hypothetical protein B7R54_08485 [Subtercola boreus]TQL53713.1 carboxypeptidase family protein [Subtercola boreus]
MTAIVLRGAPKRFTVATFITILALLALVFVAPQAAQAATGIGGVQVLDAASKPVVGARVSLTSTTQSYTFDFATDSAGVATFTKNPVFSSMLFTVYVAPKAGSGLLPGYWDGKPSGQTAPQTITPGGAKLKYVAKAGTAASIAGTVTGSGTPAVALAGVKVTALTATGLEAGSATTSSTGGYKVSGLSVDSYTLRFDNTNAAYASTTWWKNKPAQQSADVFPVAAGQSLTGQNIVLDKVTTISGTVKGSAATPVALANVYVTAYADTGFTAGSTSTSATGKYVLVLPAGGTYKLLFNNYQNDDFLSSTWWRNKQTQETADTITVASGKQSTGNNIVLDKVASISGTVTGAGTPAVPLMTSVTAYTTAGSYAGYGYADSTGAYTVSGLPAGSYKLFFNNSSNSTFVSSAWWKNKPTMALADVITVTSGQVVTGKNLTLPKGTSISGSVKGSGSPTTPLAGINVVAYPGDDNTYAASAYTDSAGNYTLPGLLAGSYKLKFYNNASTSFVSSGWYNNQPTREKATVVTLTAGTPVTGRSFVLAKSASISGTVTGAGTPATPLPNVNVTAYTRAGDYVGSGFTDASGQYVISGLAADTYRLQFRNNYSNQAFESQTWWKNKPTADLADPITLAAGATRAGTDITLAKAVVISGTVTDASGSGVSGVTVPVWRLVNGSYLRLTDFYNPGTDSSGRYTLPGLSPGSYKVGFTDYSTGNSLDGTGGVKYQDEFWNDKATLTAATPIPLTAGQTATSNASLSNKLLTFTKTAVPTVTGTTQVGKRLTATPGTWTPAPETFTYQWKSGGVAISGARSSSYVATSADVGKTLTVSVTGSKTGYKPVTTTSLATGKIVP